MRLNATTIRTLALPAGKRDYVFFDGELHGFGLRLRDTGARSWLVQYSFGGRVRRMTLGSPDTVEPGKAREAAKDILAKVRLGKDPILEKQVVHQEAANIVGVLIERHLQHQRGRLRPRSLYVSERCLTQYLRSLHALPINRLDRRVIAARLAEITKDSGPAMANRARSALSAFCIWAAREGLIETNPCAFTNKAAENGPREHLIGVPEFTAIWAALGEDRYSTITKLLFLTGARRDEIASLRWSEVDFADALISLPAERCKNKRPHVIPLSTQALAILRACQNPPWRERPRGGPFVFAASGRAGFQNWNRCKRDLDARIAASGATVAHWTLHDARRLISTTLHEQLGVPPHIVEAILAHVGGHQAGVAGTYNKATYLDERRRALQRWADYAMTLVTGVAPASAVVRLRG